MATTTKQTPTEFFLAHGGYSYDTLTETREQGKRRCAQSLADAEQWANDHNLSFEWFVDSQDSSEWSDEQPPWQQWVCICHDEDGSVLSCLGGIDFGRDKEPWGEPYRRVVEAELASEAMPTL